MAGRQVAAYARKGRTKVLRAMQQKSNAASRIERMRKTEWWRAIAPPMWMQVLLGVIVPRSPPRGWVAPAGWPP